jgi:hypothetical protein
MAEWRQPEADVPVYTRSDTKMMAKTIVAVCRVPDQVCIAVADHHQPT